MEQNKQEVCEKPSSLNQEMLSLRMFQLC